MFARLASLVRGAAPALPAPPPAPRPGLPHEPAFTADWFSRHIPHWQALFDRLGWDLAAPRIAVEIGCYEGVSSLWMLRHMLAHPDSRLHCIDSFGGGVEHSAAAVEGLEARFRANIETSGQTRQVTVHVGPSVERLAALLLEGVAADFVYVDGSHQAPDVLADLVLGLRLLRPGGVMICDDYLWRRPGQAVFDPLDTPKLAVDAFTTIFARQAEVLEGLHNWQVGVRKLGG